MQRKFFYFLIIILFINLNNFSQEKYLKIDANIKPKRIMHGNEGVLKIKITPKSGIKISSHPEFMIKLDKNSNLTFSKIFFKSSELDYRTKQENGTIFLDLEKEIEIPFKVNENSQITGNLIIKGEVVFTAVFKDNWSLKTYQKFNTDFITRRNYKSKKK